MASLNTVVLNSGKDKINSSIINESKPSFFKISKDNIPLSESVDISNYSFWYERAINVYKVIDSDTIEFTCIIEEIDSIQDTKSICLFLNNTPDDIPFLLGVLTKVIPSGTRQVFTLQFNFSNALEKMNFAFIKDNKMEEGLMSLSNLITLGNQITKNTALLNKLYIPEILENPCITDETFSV